MKKMAQVEQDDERAEDMTRLSTRSPKQLESEGLCLTKMTIEDSRTGTEVVYAHLSSYLCLGCPCLPEFPLHPLNDPISYLG